MPVLSVHDLTISFSGPPTLEGASLHIDASERVCVLGRNGAGKSTLLKVVAGEYGPDSGSVAFPDGGHAAMLPQEVPTSLSGSAREIVASGFGRDGELLLSLHAGDDPHRLDPERQWKMETLLEKTLKDLQLEPDARFEQREHQLAAQARAVLVRRHVESDRSLRPDAGVQRARERAKVLLKASRSRTSTSAVSPTMFGIVRRTSCAPVEVECPGRLVWGLPM